MARRNPSSDLSWLVNAGLLGLLAYQFVYVGPRLDAWKAAHANAWLVLAGQPTGATYTDSMGRVWTRVLGDAVGPPMPSSFF